MSIEEKPIARIKVQNRKAKWIIYSISAFAFLGIVMLDRIKNRPEWPFDFDVHVFAMLNAIINSCVFILLIIGLQAVKKRHYSRHRKVMMAAIALSVLFLLSYTIHHLYAGSTSFGGSGVLKVIYLLILLTHIPLSALIVPFILFAAYRALTGEYEKHKKIVRWAYPLWIYVALSGVLVYLMISPYY